MTRQSPVVAAGALFADDPIPTHTEPSSAAPEAVLLDGRRVSSWSPEWLAETGSRETEARAILRLREKDERQSRLAAYTVGMARHARLNLPGVDPEAYSAEARRRLEAVVLACWHRAREASAKPSPEAVA